MPRKNKTPGFVFISIDNGDLCLSVEHKDVLRVRATRVCGCRKVAEWLRDNNVTEWCYSSSVDFPHEYGAPRINFRLAIAEAFAKAHKIPMEELFDPINGGARP